MRRSTSVGRVSKVGEAVIVVAGVVVVLRHSDGHFTETKQFKNQDACSTSLNTPSGSFHLLMIRESQLVG